MAALLNFFFELFLTVFFKLKHLDLEYPKKGWYLMKRKWVWIVLSPVFLPFVILIFGISGIVKYFQFVFTYYNHWINSDATKLTYRQIINYKKRLL